MCNNMLNKAEALRYGQSEHLEPVITVCLSLREGSKFYLHEGSFVQCCLVHMSAAQPPCSWNCWQRMLLRCIEWQGRVPANLFGRCSYLKVKLNLGASPPEWKLCSCWRVSCPDSGIGRVCSWSRDSPQVLQWVGGGWSPAETEQSMCAVPCSQLSLTGPFPFPGTWIFLMLRAQLMGFLEDGDETTESGWQVNGSRNSELSAITLYAPKDPQHNSCALWVVTFNKCLFLKFPFNLSRVFRPYPCTGWHRV